MFAQESRLESYEVLVYLSSVLEDAQKNDWNSFPKLVKTLVRLEDEGYSLSSRNSRCGCTASFDIRDRAVQLMPQYVNSFKQKIDMLKSGCKKDDELVDMIDVMKMYNEYHLYHSNKKKINLSSFDGHIFNKGVVPLLDLFERTGDWKSAELAVKNSGLAQKNLDKRMAEFLNLTKKEFRKYIL